MIIINLWDIDGTLCPSIFNNARLKNDNKNCLTPEFLKDLAEVEPFDWVDYQSYESGNFEDCVNIIVTGRLPEHRQITMEWFRKHLHTQPNGFVSVTWDDTKATREASYADYVRRKSQKLVDLIYSWERAIVASCILRWRINVFEDDKPVLGRVFTETRGDMSASSTAPKCWLVVDGEAPVEMQQA